MWNEVIVTALSTQSQSNTTAVGCSVEETLLPPNVYPTLVVGRAILVPGPAYLSPRAGKESERPGRAHHLQCTVL